MTLSVLLASAVYACPMYTEGEPLPVSAMVGCPVPVSGLIYPDSHPHDDQQAIEALALAGRELTAARSEVESMRSAPGPATWATIGAIAGALLTYGIIAGVE